MGSLGSARWSHLPKGMQLKMNKTDPAQVCLTSSPDASPAPGAGSLSLVLDGQRKAKEPEILMVSWNTGLYLHLGSTCRMRNGGRRTVNKPQHSINGKESVLCPWAKLLVFYLLPWQLGHKDKSGYPSLQEADPGLCKVCHPFLKGIQQGLYNHPHFPEEESELQRREWLAQFHTADLKIQLKPKVHILSDYHIAPF